MLYCILSMQQFANSEHTAIGSTLSRLVPTPLKN